MTLWAAASLGRSPVDRGVGYIHCLYIDHQVCLVSKGKQLEFSFTFYFWLTFAGEFYACPQIIKGSWFKDHCVFPKSTQPKGENLVFP